jgi:hypothetical protein
MQSPEVFFMSYLLCRYLLPWFLLLYNDVVARSDSSTPFSCVLSRHSELTQVEFSPCSNLHCDTHSSIVVVKFVFVNGSFLVQVLLLVLLVVVLSSN